MLLVSIGYQQEPQTAQSARRWDAARTFRVPHNRHYLFILHSDAKQRLGAIRGAASVLAAPARTFFISLQHQISTEAIE